MYIQIRKTIFCIKNKNLTETGVYNVIIYKFKNTSF